MRHRIGGHIRLIKQFRKMDEDRTKSRCHKFNHRTIKEQKKIHDGSAKCETGNVKQWKIDKANMVIQMNRYLYILNIYFSKCYLTKLYITRHHWCS